MSVRKAIGIIALSATVTLGCNDVVSEPSDSDPADPTTGALEVSITVTGTRPSPDGYAVVVGIQDQDDLALKRVESPGGMARFHDLPAGEDYSVRVEPLSDHCSVEGVDSRPFIIRAGQTTRVWFTVFCPGPTTGTITGTVTIGDAPLIGVAVTGTDGAVTLGATTGRDGTFEWELPAGEYTVEARATGISCEGRNVNLLAGGIRTVEIPCAVSRDPSDVPEIYLANTDGSGATFLAKGSRPAWSPDGLRIAFDRGGQIHVITVDGSGETSLNRGIDPAWSPNGRRIVFVDEECPSPSCSPRDHGISVMDADGSNVNQLVTGDFVGSPTSMGVGMPAWSPDGETIAFDYFGDGDNFPAHIYLMNADGSEPRRLGTAVGGIQYAESDPDWSPGGSRLAFWSYGYGVATLAAAGGLPNTVYRQFPFVHFGAKPVWSPDGNTIAFTADRNGRAMGPFLYIVDSDGGEPRLLIAGAYDAAWSPDGARIAFVQGSP